jgi:hypothetical protein
MILVAMVAVGMFVVRTRQRWREFHEEAEHLELVEEMYRVDASLGDSMTTRYREQAKRWRLKVDPASPEFQRGSENWAEGFRQAAQKYEDKAAQSDVQTQASLAKSAEAARLKRYYRSQWW